MLEKTLNRLLSDPNFIELDISLKKYNVFRALKVKDYEIRHSEFLGHLLNPNETHGLGAEFLTNFLLCLSNGTGIDLDLSELDLDLTEVQREWSGAKRKRSSSNELEPLSQKDNNARLDLLLRVPLRYERRSYCDIAIEMKWRAKQHKGQLKTYTGQLEKAGIKPKASVLLTINGEDPEQEAKDWLGVTYQDVVVSALKNTLQKQADSTSQKVINTIEDWLDILIEESSEESSEKSAVDENCDKLLDYKAVLEKNSDFLSIKYPSAYERLKNYIREDGDTRGKVLKAFNEIKKDFVAVYSNRTYLRFYPASVYPFAQNIGGFPTESEGISYPLIWEILVWEAEDKIKLRLVLTLAKLDESYTIEDRELIAKRVRDKFQGQEWSFTKGAITNNWTRIIRTDWEISENNETAVMSHVRGLISKAKEMSVDLEAVLNGTSLISQS